MKWACIFEDIWEFMPRRHTCIYREKNAKKERSAKFNDRIDQTAFLFFHLSIFEHFSVRRLVVQIEHWCLFLPEKYYLYTYFVGKDIHIFHLLYIFSYSLSQYVNFDSLKQTNVIAAAPTAAITIPNNQVNHITTAAAATATTITTNLNGNSMNNNVKTSAITGSNGNTNNGINGLGLIMGDDVSSDIFFLILILDIR